MSLNNFITLNQHYGELSLIYNVYGKRKVEEEDSRRITMNSSPSSLCLVFSKCLLSSAPSELSLVQPWVEVC